MPYRSIKPTEEVSEEDRQLSMFGVIEREGKWVPVLKRQHKGLEACKGCNGFGTGGNPFCGVIYTCQSCNGDGKRRDVPSRWERFLFWLKGK